MFVGDNILENLRLYIKNKTAEVRNSDYNFKSLFDVIHNQENRIFAEYDDAYRTSYISYNDFRKYCLGAATFLASKTAADGPDYVGLYMENSINWVATFWAILMIGKKPVLLNKRLPDTVNSNILSMLGVRDVVLCEGTTTSLSIENPIAIEGGQGYCREYKNAEEYIPGNWGDEIALTTTATSQNYKICFYSGNNFTHQVLNAKGILEQNKAIKKHYHGALKQLTFLPFYHIFGLVATYFWFSVYGRTFVFMNDYSPQTILKTVKKHEVTHVFAVPLLWNTVASEIRREIAKLSDKERAKAEKGFELSVKLQKIFPNAGMRAARRIFRQITSKTFGDSICFLISGGGYISDDTLRIINAVGYPLHNGYGSTETGITSVELRENIKYRLTGSVGRPFDSLKYKIESGVLSVSGSSTCSRILDKNGVETNVNEADWFNTNDCAFSDKGSNYFINGRNDDVILGENGEKINPDLLEKRLSMACVSDYCVLGLCGSPTLVFRVNENANVLELKKVCTEVENALKTLSDEGFDNVKCFYTFNNLLPANAIKISRKHLLSDIDGKKVSLRPFTELKALKNRDIKEVSSEIVDRVKAAFANVLCREASEIGVDDHFIFDLGGTSLDYCSLLIALDKEFGSEVIRKGEKTVREFSQAVIECYERS